MCLVSIIIPVFNRKDLVYKMVESIIQQTYQKWELLLIDDGSTDGALEMCNEIASTDERIRTYTRLGDKKGASVCRNIGLKLSRGKYVVFFDSDDLISPSCLQQRIDYMEGNPQFDFSIFPTIGFCKNIGDTPFYSGINCTQKSIDYIISGWLPFLVVTNIYKRTYLMMHQITWDENLKFFQDQDFNIQCLVKGAVYNYAPDACFDYFYRIIPGSNSIAQNIGKSENFLCHIYFLDKLYSEYKKSTLINKKSIERRIVYIYRKLIDPVQKKGIIDWAKNVNVQTYIRLRCSHLIYVFFHKICFINSRYSFLLAFPFYVLTNKMYQFHFLNIAKKKKMCLQK